MLMLFSRRKPIRVMFSCSAMLTAMLVGADRPERISMPRRPLFAPFQNSAATRQLPEKHLALLPPSTSAPNHFVKRIVSSDVFGKGQEVSVDVENGCGMRRPGQREDGLLGFKAGL